VSRALTPCAVGYTYYSYGCDRLSQDDNRIDACNDVATDDFTNGLTMCYCAAGGDLCNTATTAAQHTTIVGGYMSTHDVHTRALAAFVAAAIAYLVRTL
jgi:hypothetical protein